MSAEAENGQNATNWQRIEMLVEMKTRNTELQERVKRTEKKVEVVEKLYDGMKIKITILEQTAETLVTLPAKTPNSWRKRVTAKKSCMKNLYI